MIPEDLKIFSLIYEYRFWLIIPLLIFWLMGGFYFLFRLKKVFFLWLLIFPVVIQPLNIAATWCGWHYRMELRERFAGDDRGWTDPYTAVPININRMPPEIRAEYAKHNYHPRYRDMKVMTVGTIAATILSYIFGGLIFIVIKLLRKCKKNIPETGKDQAK